MRTLKDYPDEEEAVCESLENMDISTADDEDENKILRLDTLPAEILLHILNYLDVKFIVDVFAGVCIKFKDVANNDATWRIRISRRWPGQYPAIPLVNENCEIRQLPYSTTDMTIDNTDGQTMFTEQNDAFSWTEACIAREEETRIWTNPEVMMKAIVCSNAHYSSVDCVKIIKDLVISGSRDRGINIWNIDDVKKGVSKPCLKLPDAHKGWVWSFSSKSGEVGGTDLVSGSWDNTVKFWSLSSSSLLETRKPVNLKVAVLSTDMLENTVVAGTYDKKVVIMDAREEVKKMTFYRSHSKPVLGVKMTPRHILSLSEDQTLVVYDRVAGKRFKRVHIPGDSFPLSLSLSLNSLYVGDKSGSVHLIDTSYDRFDVIHSYTDTGHRTKITSVTGGLGSVITASSAADVRIHQPDRGLGLIKTISNPDCGELAQISYDSTPGRQTLAAGFSNNTVKIWTRAD